MRRFLPILILTLGLVPLMAHAGIDAFPFTKPHNEQRFLQLTRELRCLVCQNESLASSNAALAQDLRREVYQMIEAGKSNKEIIGFLVKRYGDYVLYLPPVVRMTYLLWFGPLLLLVVGAIVLLVFVRHRSAEARAATGLSDDEQHRLDDLLNATKEKR